MDTIIMSITGKTIACHITHLACDGYWHSYNYEWNQLAQEQNQQSNQQSSQTINIYNYGNGNTFNTGQGTSQGSDQGQNQSP
jgi:hypothetical protein